MKETPVLRLNSKADGVFAPHFANRVGDAVDIFDRALSDGSLALTGESGNRPIRPSEIDGVGCPRHILKTHILNPIPATQTNGRVQMIGPVVSQAYFVDHRRSDRPGFTHG